MNFWLEYARYKFRHRKIYAAKKNAFRRGAMYVQPIPLKLRDRCLHMAWTKNRKLRP